MSAFYGGVVGSALLAASARLRQLLFLLQFYCTGPKIWTPEFIGTAGSGYGAGYISVPSHLTELNNERARVFVLAVVRVSSALFFFPFGPLNPEQPTIARPVNVG